MDCPAIGAELLLKQTGNFADIRKEPLPVVINAVGPIELGFERLFLRRVFLHALLLGLANLLRDLVDLCRDILLAMEEFLDTALHEFPFVIEVLEQRRKKQGQLLVLVVLESGRKIVDLADAIRFFRRVLGEGPRQIADLFACAVDVRREMKTFSNEGAIVRMVTTEIP